MVKTNIQKFTYEYPWEVVVESYLRRFPMHKRMPVLLGTEVLHDAVNPETNVRQIHRRCIIDVEAPGWFKSMLKVYDFTFLQKTWIDPAKRNMRIVNCNVSFGGTLRAGDECEYKVHPDNPNWTIFLQQAWMELPDFPLSGQCEKFMVRSYDKNTSEGRQIDLTFIRDVAAENFGSKPMEDQVASILSTKPGLTGGKGGLVVPQALLEAGWNVLCIGTPNLPTRFTDPDPVPKPKEAPAAAVSDPIAIDSTPTSSAESVTSSNENLPASTSTTIAASAPAPSTSKLAQRAKRQAPRPNAVSSTEERPPVAAPAAPAAPKRKRTVLAVYASWYHIMFSRAAIPALLTLIGGLGTCVALPPRIAEYGGFTHHVIANALLMLVFTMVFMVGHGIFFSDVWARLLRPTPGVKPSPYVIEEEEGTVLAENPASPVSIELDDNLDGEGDDPSDDDDDEELTAGEYEEDEDSEVASDSSTKVTPTVTRAERKQEHVGVDFALSECKSVSVVAWIERVFDYRVHYVFLVDVQLTNGTAWTLEKLTHDFVVLSKQLTDVFKYNPAVKLELSTPPSHSDDLQSVLAQNDRLDHLNQYIKQVVKDDMLRSSPDASIVTQFLQSRAEDMSHPDVPGTRDPQARKVIREDFLTRARWRSCWRDVLAVLDADKLETYDYESKQPSAVIQLADILSVRRLETPPFHSNSFFEIETESESHYLFCRSEETAQLWINDILDARNKLTAEKRQAVKRKPNAIGRRLVLNNYRLCWDSSAEPCALSRSLLHEAILVYEQYDEDNRQLSPKVRQLFNAFARRVADLQVMPVSKLNDTERMVFFVNVYHTLTLHANMELARPGSQPKVSSIATFAHYDIEGRLFSLVDIDQCVLRAAMSKSRLFFSGSPRFSKRDSRLAMALKEAEPRLNFVLNNGTSSAPQHLWILDTTDLHEQLDHAALHIMSEQASVDTRKRIVTLPTVCRWYYRDFGKSTAEVLRFAIKFFPKNLAETVQKMLKDGGSTVKVRFRDNESTFRGFMFDGSNHRERCGVLTPM